MGGSVRRYAAVGKQRRVTLVRGRFYKKGAAKLAAPRERGCLAGVGCFTRTVWRLAWL
jgi:hypothetical protein